MGTEITLKKAKAAGNIVNVFTEFLRITNLLLEARRKELCLGFTMRGIC
jgi:predicted metallo-beta-lactamase superfamily hydrolase